MSLKQEEIPDEVIGMECPCQCSCGMWFDLHDGYAAQNSTTLICPACKSYEMSTRTRIDELEDLILECSNAIDGRENVRENKKLRTKYKKELRELDPENKYLEY